MHERCESLDLYPLTRIASDDAMRPLPARGERCNESAVQDSAMSR
jgi:hypothetical protein